VKCRFCGAEAQRTFLDLGMQPLSNAYVPSADVDREETFYPLHARVCERCLLVQLPECASRETIFSDYAYLSSMSASWLAHAKEFAATATDRFGLNGASRVVEVASNDGYLLKYFMDRGITVLGVEPAANVAEVARKAGVPTETRFFGRDAATEVALSGGQADLVVANNVLAHVPDLNDFVSGLSGMVKPDGVVSIEFPHLARLLENRQFDTIYHEHFSYFSLGTAMQVLEAHGLSLFDVEELSTHGGSLRLYAQRSGAGRPITESVARVAAAEEREGGRSLTRYDRFSSEVVEVKRALLTFLIEAKRAGKSIAGYGAPAKGNTLLNYVGARADFIDYVVDRSPLKQGTLLPGTRIPVYAPEHLARTRPDIVLVLPWNLAGEIATQLAFVREWGACLVVPIPEVRVLS
jgi:2-polyprenyl-3-methyl-5-hydroxy-6-metoxy-1,4-benzoquinol methylase